MFSPTAPSNSSTRDSLKIYPTGWKYLGMKVFRELRNVMMEDKEQYKTVRENN